MVAATEEKAQVEAALVERLAAEQAVVDRIPMPDGGEDKQLSNGLLMLNGIILEGTLLIEQKLQSAVRSVTLHKSWLNKLCNVQITYAFVSDAVEATISVQLPRGDFYGQITACTNTIKDSILLHDNSKLLGPGDGVMVADDHGNGCVRLLRQVMAICFSDTLIMTVVADQADGTDYTRETVKFTAAVNGGEEAQIGCGVATLLVKVNWSLMNPKEYKSALPSE
uniref:DUF6598 domain-containing protein n=1 Tax=Leersia perrieri TaxID=77586 RepID=A0A0D9Y1J3_9ORYZ